eukprot:TRINITY_DN4575_c0_g1_i1.p1 TRINITY_DN4575_c0_g1~~TRINITY_DN4575_c0_g1_i1.p1  ORF type:complete len:649 (+),score=235.30 TRINITY_DN4575_c0_g1_i1:214-2160(+)
MVDADDDPDWMREFQSPMSKDKGAAGNRASPPSSPEILLSRKLMTTPIDLDDEATDGGPGGKGKPPNDRPVQLSSDEEVEEPSKGPKHAAPKRSAASVEAGSKGTKARAVKKARVVLEDEDEDELTEETDGGRNAINGDGAKRGQKGRKRKESEGKDGSPEKRRKPSVESNAKHASLRGRRKVDSEEEADEEADEEESDGDEGEEEEGSDEEWGERKAPNKQAKPTSKSKEKPSQTSEGEATTAANAKEKGSEATPAVDKMKAKTPARKAGVQGDGTRPIKTVAPGKISGFFSATDKPSAGKKKSKNDESGNTSPSLKTKSGAKSHDASTSKEVKAKTLSQGKKKQEEEETEEGEEEVAVVLGVRGMSNGANTVKKKEEKEEDGIEDPVLASLEGQEAAAPADADGAEKKPKTAMKAPPSLPLVLAEKIIRSKVLVECAEDDQLDLSGDAGAVGRVLVRPAKDKGQGGEQLFFDLKGSVYRAIILPTTTFLVVNVGQSEAKVEAIMNDFVQLEEDKSLQGSMETVVEGTLDGLALGSDDEREAATAAAAAAAAGGDGEGQEAGGGGPGKKRKPNKVGEDEAGGAKGKPRKSSVPKLPKMGGGVKKVGAGKGKSKPGKGKAKGKAGAGKGGTTKKGTAKAKAAGKKASS